jgi:hypothetical protein
MDVEEQEMNAQAMNPADEVRHEQTAGTSPLRVSILTKILEQVTVTIGQDICKEDPKPTTEAGLQRSLSKLSGPYRDCDLALRNAKGEIIKDINEHEGEIYDMFMHPCGMDGIIPEPESWSQDDPPRESNIEGEVLELHLIIANRIQAHTQDQASCDMRSSPENGCQAHDACIEMIQRINSVTGMLVLSAPATVEAQLEILNSSYVAGNADFACLEYTRQNMFMQVIAAALITRGYHGYSAELIADIVRHLAREAGEQCHRTCLGLRNQIDATTLKELGFGIDTSPHTWTYAHLCYLEMVLDVEIHILGHECSINLPADQQELAAHVN